MIRKWEVAKIDSQLNHAIELFKDIMIYGTERVIKSIDHEVFQTYSSEQLHMMQIISKTEQVSPGRLASLQGVHKSAVSNRIKKLSSQGLVKVTGSNLDQRGKTISLTREGQEIVNTSNEAISTHIEGLLAQELESEEIEEFIRIFEKLKTIMKVEEDKA
ncbi:MarR family transcriptional regulator [Halobacillus salinarum]|uniref:MarR family transcriptional regulator n=1 Tax=Halobacillus salinarum TaxID=2932257 RepID=A0ABY4EF31_9BACI|nr:MarR family transcriptional regulator [Halobacillus salinarum]UOQ42766.1 MarR family transcriptional regulator [Halobacillus salinarum]